MTKALGDRVHLNIKRKIDESYDVVIGKKLFPLIVSDLIRKPLGHKYAIITDSDVLSFYAEHFLHLMKKCDLSAEIFYFNAGEKSKTTKTWNMIIEQMASKSFGRDSAVIAIGGGVVGDVGGFVAGTFCRGIRYIQIPTTLLAQADSAIGGKTGIDLKSGGKNYVGVFKQPDRVYTDVSTLETLSDEQFSCGLAETIKHGVIKSRPFFCYLERNAGAILTRSAEHLIHIAYENARIKGTVVEKDPEEKRGLRQILNFGHTIGHALEKVSDYTLLHGECVSIGMVTAGRIANKITEFPYEDMLRQEALLDKFELPQIIPESIQRDQVIQETLKDKKAREGQARYCLPVRIGKMHPFDGTYTTLVDEGLVRQII